MLTQSKLIDDGKAVSVNWTNGETGRFHAIWLRDNARDPETRAPGNGQRLITVLDIPEETFIDRVGIDGDGNLSVRFLPEEKSVTFSSAWLANHIYDSSVEKPHGWLSPSACLWDNNLSKALPTIDFSLAQTDTDARCQWLAGIRRYGVAVMTGVACEEGSVCDAAELFGYVRETNYGRLFEVRSEVEPVNLAYTNLGLQAHTDNPYRDPVPTLQLLACLENTVDGGESIIVDGFKAATLLQTEAPKNFDLLSRYCMRFEYAGEAGVKLQARRPIIELAPDGEILGIRFNSRSADAPIDIPYDQMTAWYAAYRHFAQIIERPELAITFKMAPGDLIVFDNTRTLHARTGFSGTGSRWLQGCYAEKDSLLSTLKSWEEQISQAAE
ncbi:MAG: gamma-butyrobetaine dioxygenase [Alphaproteobacteria bacterium]|jgi:[2-(trimethylamino)ethyl]phosphonate dioxygenase|nr:gamma-butyrobetaine dioxygenase [Alphaproteobacteria bacterium]MBT4016871.1 gamma-butyrobetaine dioxygenase [Alphaproteobacteria bacterium]MBT5161063.1 gamma-butyrobetaine dioxygenase [Alphaproteobacteria bacterium]MBT5920424.1 gamma-butyrobetaine dioxygenase [Alphaproteobacteria bacterium]MBT6387114.1 gamma-butyrobetaine dioxygenase [Alphaproteobacteria bacterium]